MNPQEVAQLLREVQAALARGESEESIDAALRDRFGNKARSVNHLFIQAKRHGLTRETIENGPQELDEDKGFGEKVVQAITPAIQGALGGFAPDVIEALDKVGLAAPGAADRFREDLSEERENHQVRAAATGIVGLMGGPAGRVLGGLFKGARAVAAPAGPLAGAAARGLGAGEVTSRIAQIGTAGVAAGATGATAGAAIGAGLGAGEAGASLDPADRTAAARLEATKGPAAVGAVLGTLGAGGGLIREGKRIVQQGVGRGERLATDITKESGLLGPAAKREAMAAESQAKTGLFAGVEAQGATVSAEARAVVFKNPTLLRALQRSGSEESKRLIANERAFQATQAARAAGESLPEGVKAVHSQEAMSFKLLDSIRQGLERTSKGLARRKVGGVPPDKAKIAEAQEALGLLEGTFIAERQGFTAALESASRVGTGARGFESGMKTFTKDASEVAQAFGQAVGRQGKQSFREGLLVKVNQRLRSGPDAVKGFVNQAQNSEMQTKLKILLGSERAFEKAMAEIAATRTAINADVVIEALIKFGGFRVFGSSLAGGTAIGALKN